MIQLVLLYLRFEPDLLIIGASVFGLLSSMIWTNNYFYAKEIDEGKL